MAEYANPDVLVDTDWVEEHLDDPSVRLIEVDEDTEAYEKDTSAGRSAGTGPRTSTRTSDATTGTRPGSPSCSRPQGVGPDTTVVLYGGNNNWFAAYAYWLLKLRGFDNVKLLNGGRKKWSSRAAS